MIIKKFEFSGVEYPCRIVKDNQGEYLIIGSTALLDALQPRQFRGLERGALPVRKHWTSTMRFFSSPMNTPLPCLTKSW